MKEVKHTPGPIYIYKQTEFKRKGDAFDLFTVGYYENGKWYPVSDHESGNEADQRAQELNNGFLSETAAERDRLKIYLERSMKSHHKALEERDQLKEENERLSSAYANEFHNLTSKILRLESINRELVETLKPFEKMAHAVLDDNSFKGNRVLYTFDNAEITYDDLRNVLQALKNSTL